MKTNIITRWAIGALFFTAVGFSSIANAALVGRLAATPGGTDYQAYYDTDANLTWLADANYTKTSGYSTGGRMSWNAATSWVAGLDVAGVTGWRLPTTVDVGNDGATRTSIYHGVDDGWNITAQSEMSNMYYNVLSNTPAYDTNGTVAACYNPPIYCLTNTGPFSNLQPNYYWSGTKYAPNTRYKWVFSMLSGYQTNSSQDLTHQAYNFYTWAVHSGDVKPPAPPVSAVPVPAAIWLFGSGLIGFIGLAKRKMRTLAA